MHVHVGKLPTDIMSDAGIAGNTIERYELGQLIEQSDISSTFLAFDSDTNQQVLLKLLEGPFKSDEKLRSSYLKRVRSLSRIRHPNIASILDYGITVDRQPYVVTEQIEGFPLKTRLDRLVQQEAPAHVIYALTLIRQIASGLALAERLEYFHFTLSPQHILLKNVTQGSNDAAVLVDLDLPFPFPPDTDANGDSQPTHYLSPEQLNQKPIDGRSQVYSLGVMLFQLLSGRLPAARNSRWPGPLRLLSRETATLHNIRSDLAPETYALVDRAINSRPSKRFTSVSDFLRALDHALDAEDLRIHTSNIAEPSRPWPIYIAPLLLLLLCMLLAGAFWWTNAATSASVQTPSALSDGPPRLAAILLKPISSRGPEAAAGDPGAAASVTLTATATATAISPRQLPDAASLVPAASKTPTVSSSPTAIATITRVEPSTTPTATAQLIPTSAATQPVPSPQPQYLISVSSASLRRGPGTRYPVDSYLLEDDKVTIIGRTSVGDVWLVVQTSDGRTGWISASVGQPDENSSLDHIAPAATIPPPPPTNTPTPSPTPLPTATSTEAGSSGGNGGNGGNSGSDQDGRPRATPTPPL